METRFGVGMRGAGGKDMVYTFATSLPVADVMRRVEETAAAHMPAWSVRQRKVVVKRKIQLMSLVRDVAGNLRGKTVAIKKTVLLVKFHVGGELVMTFKTEAAKAASTSDPSLTGDTPAGAPPPGIPSPLQSNAELLGEDPDTATISSEATAIVLPPGTSATTLIPSPSQSATLGPGWVEFTRVTLQTKGRRHFSTAFVKFVLCIRSRAHTLQLYNEACKHIHHSVAVYPAAVPKAAIW